MPITTPHRICIVEDCPELRRVMELMLQHTPNFELAGSFNNAKTALCKIPLLRPAAILMDINLPETSGIDCVIQLKKQLPSTIFLMCTAFADDEKIFASLRAGASGYILKTDGPAKIIHALTEALQGGSPMSAPIARKVVASFSTPPTTDPRLQQLTERESEILAQIAQGLLNKEVAQQLQIKEATVRTHIQNIYTKLHVNTRVEAVNIYYNR